jgi:hypothetical protein
LPGFLKGLARQAVMSRDARIALGTLFMARLPFSQRRGFGASGVCGGLLLPAEAAIRAFPDLPRTIPDPLN